MATLLVLGGFRSLGVSLIISMTRLSHGHFDLGVGDRDCMGNHLDGDSHKADDHIGLCLGGHAGQRTCLGHGNWCSWPWFVPWPSFCHP